MSLTKDQIIAGLTAILGADSVRASTQDMAGYLAEPRRRFTQTAQAVALPRSVAEVQKVMAWAHEVDVRIIPQAGNTGLVGGQVPLHGDEVILSILAWKHNLPPLDAFDAQHADCISTHFYVDCIRN